MHEQQDYLTSLYGANRPDILQRIKDKGKAEQTPIVSDDVGQYLQFLTATHRPRRILELGTGISYSTHWLLLGSPESQVVSVEQNADRIAISRMFLQQSGLLERVELVQAWVFEYLQNTKQKFDLIFLDSMKKEYAALLPHCLRLLNTGGILVADNVFFRGSVWQPNPPETAKNAAAIMAMKAFNTQVAAHKKLISCFLPLGDGLLVATLSE